MIVIVMGVTGAGKTTVGRLLASQLDWQFADADDFHPPANVEKMRHGIPLMDDDRRPWLLSLHEEITKWIGGGRSVVLACSALKRSYRQELAAGPEVHFVYLKGSKGLITERLLLRHGHFADEKILAGQFDDLEEPGGESGKQSKEDAEQVVTVDIIPAPEQIVTRIRQELGLA